MPDFLMSDLVSTLADYWFSTNNAIKVPHRYAVQEGDATMLRNEI